MCGIIGYVGGRASKAAADRRARAARVPRLRLCRASRCSRRTASSTSAPSAISQFLKDAAESNGSASTTGLGHTRWATHGGVTELNAHPLTGCDEQRARDRPQRDRRELPRAARGARAPAATPFQSETDAEVVAHLLEDAYDGDLVAAVRAVYQRLEGHFTFVVIHQDHPNHLVGVRNQTPMVVGIGKGEMFLASNLAAFLSETRQVQYPGDGEIASITPAGVEYVNARHRRACRARRRRRRLGRRRGRALRLRDVHAQGDLRAARGRRRDDRRPRAARPPRARGPRA